MTGVGGGPLLVGDGHLGGAATGVLVTTALGTGAAALGVVAGLGVVADLLLDVRRHVGCLVGHLDEVAAAGVARHLHDPAGPDETGLGELGPVRLHAVLVELEDLLVAAPVTEVPLGYLPEGVVVTALGRLDPVELRVALLGGAAAGVGVGGGVRGLFGEGRRGAGGLLLLLGEDARGGLGGRDGRLLVGVVAVPELRQTGREAGGGRADEQQRGDELPRQQLTRPRARHPARHADTRQRGLHLHEHARRELRPRQPHDDGEDVQERVDRDLLLKPVETRHTVRQRPPDLRGQRARHADEQHGQGEEGEERLHEVPERTPPDPHGLRGPVPRGGRGPRRRSRTSRRTSRRA